VSHFTKIYANGYFLKAMKILAPTALPYTQNLVIYLHDTRGSKWVFNSNKLFHFLQLAPI